MIYTGHAIEGDKKQGVEKMILAARSKIKTYPTLNGIVNNFNDPGYEVCPPNYILSLASDAVSSPWLFGKPDINAEEKISKFEKLFCTILPTLPKEKRKKIEARLRGYDENHWMQIREIEFYLDMQKNNKISGIAYEDPKFGNHDFHINVEDTEFNIEHTSLGANLIQQIVESGLSLAANKIIPLLPEKKMIKLDVKTAMLLKEEGNNNATDICNKIVDDYKNISPIVSEMENTSCSFGDIGDSAQTLIQLKDIFQYYDSGPVMTKLLETEAGLTFLTETSQKEIQENSIEVIYAFNRDRRELHIHSVCCWPSKSESLRKESLLRQFKARVCAKITDGQLRGKTNAVIAMQFQDVLFMEYTRKKEFGEEHLIELTHGVEEAFNTTRENDILAVII